MSADGKRNDSVHFPTLNGSGHRRRKVVNLPALNRCRMDPVERRALALITEIGVWLDEREAGCE